MSLNSLCYSLARFLEIQNKNAYMLFTWHNSYCSSAMYSNNRKPRIFRLSKLNRKLKFRNLRWWIAYFHVNKNKLSFFFFLITGRGNWSGTSFWEETPSRIGQKPRKRSNKSRGSRANERGANLPNRLDQRSVSLSSSRWLGAFLRWRRNVS